MSALDEPRYNGLVADAFKRLLKRLDAIDPDLLEADSTGDMVTLTSANGEKCVVNTQRAVRQIWVAGAGQGVHFSYDAEAGLWKDDKGKGMELFAFLTEVVRGMSGAGL